MRSVFWGFCSVTTDDIFRDRLDHMIDCAMRWVNTLTRQAGAHSPTARLRSREVIADPFCPEKFGKHADDVDPHHFTRPASHTSRSTGNPSQAVAWKKAS